MPPTGVQNVPLIAGYELGNLFGHAAIPVAAIGGLFARAYESAPVRNALIRLGKAEAGSAEETAAKGQLYKLLPTTAAQSLLHAANENVPASAVAGQGEEQQNAQ